MSDRVTLRVEEGRKEEWQQAVEESPEYESLSHMVKLAVHREINDLHGQVEGTESYSPDTTNGEIMDAIRGLRGDVNEVASDVQLVQEEVTGIPDIPPPTPDGFLDVFPTSKSNAVTTHDILDEFEELSMPGLHRIMEQVETQVDHIKHFEKEGERHYYKEI